MNQLTWLFLLTLVVLPVWAGPQEDLFKAAEGGKVEAVMAALVQGAKVDGEDADGWTALMFAATKGQADVVLLLVSNGAGINHATKKGQTPLMGAALAGDAKTVKFLLEKGAKVDTRSAEGLTALSIAKKKQHAEAIALLEHAVPTTTPPDKKTKAKQEKPRVAQPPKNTIPSQPQGDPGKIVLPSGLTLFDWTEVAPKRVDAGEANQVLDEAANYLHQYGPHSGILAAIDKGLTQVIEANRFTDASSAQAALSKLGPLRERLGTWPALILQIARAKHVAGDFKGAQAGYSEWLQAARPDDPNRAMVREELLKAQTGKATEARDIVQDARLIPEEVRPPENVTRAIAENPSCAAAPSVSRMRYQYETETEVTGSSYSPNYTPPNRNLNFVFFKVINEECEALGTGTILKCSRKENTISNNEYKLSDEDIYYSTCGGIVQLASTSKWGQYVLEDIHLEGKLWPLDAGNRLVVSTRNQEKSWSDDKKQSVSTHYYVITEDLRVVKKMHPDQWLAVPESLKDEGYLISNSYVSNLNTNDYKSTQKSEYTFYLFSSTWKIPAWAREETPSTNNGTSDFGKDNSKQSTKRMSFTNFEVVH